MKKNIVLSILGLLFIGITHAQIKKNIGDFSTVKVADRISLNLVPSSENYIEIKGDDAEDVLIKNKAGKLVVRMKTTKFMDGNNIEATLYYKTIDELTVANGASIESSEKLDVSSIKVTANKGGFINLNVDATRLEAKASAGGSIDLTGSTDLLNATVNSGGQISAQDFHAKNANLQVSAGGELKAHVSKTADAKVNMGGNIYIYGNPEITEKITAGGKVHHKG